MTVREQFADRVERVTWPSGLRLVTEHVPNARTVAMGLWTSAGSRDEGPAQQGITHLIEHMFFKGTSGHDAQALALEMNALGGHFNAFTTQEAVCIHARVIEEHLERALRLLVEMHRNSTFSPDEFERERSVVLEEIKLTNDTPDDLIHDLFQETLWGDHGLGRSILGVPETIGALMSGDLVAHLGRLFGPGRVVVTMAGAVEPRAAEELVAALLGDLTGNGGRADAAEPPTAIYRRRHVERRLEQTHFCLGSMGPCRVAEDRYAFNILSAILGGGASSRIFQEIRERRGLAYSIGTFASPYHDTGCFGVCGGTSPSNLPDVFRLSIEALRRVCEEPVSAEELENAKEQMRAHLLLGLESMNHRMSRLAELEIYFRKYHPLEETLARVEAVTADDLVETARHHLSGAALAVATIGPGLDPANSVPETM